MFEVGKEYQTFNGELRLVEGKANEGTEYETVYTVENGRKVHRYNTLERGFGRITGSSVFEHDSNNFIVTERMKKHAPQTARVAAIRRAAVSFANDYGPLPAANEGSNEAKHAVATRLFKALLAEGLQIVHDPKSCMKAGAL